MVHFRTRKDKRVYPVGRINYSLDVFNSLQTKLMQNLHIDKDTARMYLSVIAEFNVHNEFEALRIARMIKNIMLEDEHLRSQDLTDHQIALKIRNSDVNKLNLDVNEIEHIIREAS